MGRKTPTDLPGKSTNSYQLKEKQMDALLEVENCGGKYTLEQLERWKELGLTQPEFISNSDWAKGADLTPRQIMICKCSALMMRNPEIAELVGMSETYVSSVLTSLAGKSEIEKIQEKFLSNTKKMLDDVLPLAIKTAFQVMLDPKTKPQTKADAAFRFMDRVMGRPTQHIEMNDNLIRQVYEKLDEKNVIDIASKRIENALMVTESVDSTDPTEEKELDPVDAWIKENL